MSEETIRIHVNGEPRTVPSGQTVAGLLGDLDVERGRVVVELNREIVRRNEVEDVALEEGDRVELVKFVGGG